jgi:hypothetical protein
MNDMLAVCAAVNDAGQQASCRRLANLYYFGVSRFGQWAYDEAQRRACGTPRRGICGGLLPFPPF